MNISEENIPLQTMLDVARSQPDYNHAFPILEVIQTHYMCSPYANEVIRLINEIKVSFRGVAANDDSAPTSKRNMPIPVNVHRAGRPKRAGKKIMKSFIYHAYDDEDTNLRLQGLYNGLLQLGWIAIDTNLKSFQSIFSGEDTSCRIVWTGDINTLTELFKELVTRKQYVELPEGESIWVMVNARFWEKEGNHEFGNNRLRSTSTPTANKITIDWLVKLMDPSLTLDELREAMMSQR